MVKLYVVIMSNIGAGAVVIHNVKILDNSIIGAGATIVRDIASNKLCYSGRVISLD